MVKPGTQSRDFTHVNDIVSGLLKLIDVNKNHEWFLRSGKNVKINDLALLFSDKIKYIDERRGERFTSEYFDSDTENKLKWLPVHDLEVWIKNIKNKK